MPELKPFNVMIRTQVFATDLDHAIEEVADFSWRLPSHREIDIAELDKLNNVSTTEK